MSKWTTLAVSVLAAALFIAAAVIFKSNRKAANIEGPAETDMGVEDFDPAEPTDADTENTFDMSDGDENKTPDAGNNHLEKTPDLDGDEDETDPEEDSGAESESEDPGQSNAP